MRTTALIGIQKLFQKIFVQYLALHGLCNSSTRFPAPTLHAAERETFTKDSSCRIVAPAIFILRLADRSDEYEEVQVAAVDEKTASLDRFPPTWGLLAHGDE